MAPGSFTAVRGGALAHPHEYALIYASPVPGYQAPQETIPSGNLRRITQLVAIRRR